MRSWLNHQLPTATALVKLDLASMLRTLSAYRPSLLSSTVTNCVGNRSHFGLCRLYPTFGWHSESLIFAADSFAEGFPTSPSFCRPSLYWPSTTLVRNFWLLWLMLLGLWARQWCPHSLDGKFHVSRPIHFSFSGIRVLAVGVRGVWWRIWPHAT